MMANTQKALEKAHSKKSRAKAVATNRKVHKLKKLLGLSHRDRLPDHYRGNIDAALKSVGSRSSVDVTALRSTPNTLPARPVMRNPRDSFIKLLAELVVAVADEIVKKRGGQ
jgi:hypothetical protein